MVVLWFFCFVYVRVEKPAKSICRHWNSLPISGILQWSCVCSHKSTSAKIRGKNGKIYRSEDGKVSDWCATGTSTAVPLLFSCFSFFWERISMPILYISKRFQAADLCVCVAFHYFNQYWTVILSYLFFCIQHYLRCFPHHISNVSECNCKQHSVPAFHIGRSNFYACNSNLPLSYSFPAALCSGLLFYADTMETSLVMTEVGMLLFFVYLSLQVEYAFLAAKHQDIFLCVHTLMCICVYLFGYWSVWYLR